MTYVNLVSRTNTIKKGGGGGGGGEGNMEREIAWSCLINMYSMRGTFNPLSLKYFCRGLLESDIYRSPQT